jgi:hypothetical protein
LPEKISDRLNRERIYAKLFVWTGNSTTHKGERKQKDEVGLEVLTAVTLKIPLF